MKNIRTIARRAAMNRANMVWTGEQQNQNGRNVMRVERPRDSGDQILGESARRRTGRNMSRALVRFLGIGDADSHPLTFFVSLFHSCFISFVRLFVCLFVCLPCLPACLRAWLLARLRASRRQRGRQAGKQTNERNKARKK